MAAFTETPVPTTPDRVIEEEAVANKAFKMKELLKTIQETSEQISSLFDETGAIQNRDCGGTAEQLIDVVMKLQAQLYGTEGQWLGRNM